MLYSRSSDVAFAHYPQTADFAVTDWFQRAFPDALSVGPGAPHVDVRRSLAWLSGGRSLPPLARIRHLARASNWRPPCAARPDLAARIRIIGVVREPLEMLAAQYASWRQGATNPKSRDPLVTAAREGRFADFVRQAIGGRLPSYAAFFDAGGPAWPNTRLVHFANLEEGLARACREFGLDAAIDLPLDRCGSVRTGAVPPGAALPAGLAARVRRHFAWYYDTYGHTDHPAACRRPRARIAA